MNNYISESGNQPLRYKEIYMMGIPRKSLFNHQLNGACRPGLANKVQSFIWYWPLRA